MNKTSWTNETRKLSDLIPWPRNPRQIDKAEAKRLVESFDAFGQVEAIAIGPNNEVYNGHQRIKVLLATHGEDYEVDVRVASRELTEKEREKLTVFLHRGAVGEWNFDAFDGWDVDELVEWGFEAWEVESLFQPDEPLDDPGAQPDRAAELREKWGVESGQLWQLGDHRLICGDCTDEAVIARVMNGEKAEILFTSPPYSDIRDYKGADVLITSIIQFIPAFYNFTKYQIINLGIKRKNNDVIEYWNDYIDIARKCGYKLLSWNVWDKMLAGSVSNQTSMFAIEHEWIFVFGDEPKQLNRTVEKSPNSEKRLKYNKLDSSGRMVRAVRQRDGTFKDSTKGRNFEQKNLPTVVQVFPEMARGIATDAHPAVMPIALPSVYVEAMTDATDCVVDPFLGSGTTLIACERLGRKCRAIEIDPGYCAVAIERWADMTGGEPVNLG